MDRRRSIIGVFLILLGVIVALGNLDMVRDLVILPVISMVFLFLYFYLGGSKRKGNLGFLIPGVIVGVVGLYAVLEEGGYIPSQMEPIFLVMLGAGFLLIMFIHTMRIEGPWGERFWPIFPGGILVIIGAIAVITEEDNTAMGFITPAILILIGISILIRPMLRSKDRDNGNKKEL